MLMAPMLHSVWSSTMPWCGGREPASCARSGCRSKPSRPPVRSWGVPSQTSRPASCWMCGSRRRTAWCRRPSYGPQSGACPSSQAPAPTRGTSCWAQAYQPRSPGMGPQASTAHPHVPWGPAGGLPSTYPPGHQTGNVDERRGGKMSCSRRDSGGGRRPSGWGGNSTRPLSGRKGWQGVALLMPSTT